MLFFAFIKMFKFLVDYMMKDLKTRVESAKTSHLEQRRQSSGILDNSLDESFIDFSGPISLDNFYSHQKQDMFDLLHYHLATPGYRHVMSQKSSRSSFKNETILVASKETDTKLVINMF